MNRPLDLLETAELVAAEFAVEAVALDRAGVFPSANFRRLHEAGLLVITAPRALGGREASIAEAGAVIGAIAKAEPSTALILAMQYIQLATLPKGRAPLQLVQKIVGSAVREGALINAFRVEPDLGTPLRGGLPATVAEKTSNGWRVSGRKIYSTGAAGVTWAVVWARTNEIAPRVGGFVVPMDSPGVTIERTWDQLGMRATASDDVIFDRVEIPENHELDVRQPGDWGSPDERQASLHAVFIPSLYDGVARAARDWLIGFLKARRPSNLGDALASVPRIQQAVGEIEELLAVNRRLLRSAAEDADAGRHLSASEGGLLKLTVTENAITVVEKALKLTGNHGISRANPLERHYRDVLCARIHSPQEDSVRSLAGRIALGI
ncbi:acyl-CoA dehydrogenase family protein [Terrarubrum flagellatum]|uniref:acyl-CoA dehydrogenase family protein n=1 Tax=Terrirubrum flagellatum TaxID=2895980 RepID=UPI00314551D9